MQVQKLMIASLKDVMQAAMKAYAEVPRRKWVLEWPGQVVLAVTSTYWTSQVTSAIQDGTLKVRTFKVQYAE